MRDVEKNSLNMQVSIPCIRVTLYPVNGREREISSNALNYQKCKCKFRNDVN